MQLGNLPPQQPRVSLVPAPLIQALETNRKTATHEHNVFVSNDPDYLSEQLQETYPDSDIIDIAPHTSFQALFYETSHIPFSILYKPVLTALLAGKTIILNGHLPSLFFQRILSLLDKHHPHIDINGRRIEVTGKLISVQPLSSKQTMTFTLPEEKHYSANDYQQALPESEQHYIPLLDEFQRFVNRIPTGLGRPGKQHFTFSRITHMLQRFQGKHTTHPHNPIKGLVAYDYPRHSHDYAALNVIAKFLFHPTDASAVRISKLKRLLNNQPAISSSSIKEIAWKLLNCFSGKEISELFIPLVINKKGNIDLSLILTTHGFPELRQDILEKLHVTLKNVLTLNTPEPIKLDPVFKRLRLLETLLTDNSAPLILLKGPPGVGKTHTVMSLLKRMGFDIYTENEVEAWRQDASDQLKLLLLDEGNTALPNTWDFLKSITRKPTPKRKIIVTLNPESYPNRYYHSFFQNHGECIYFEMPDVDYLEKNIINAIFGKYGLDCDDHAKPLLTIYDLIVRINPTYVYSIRDIESLTERFILLTQEQPHISSNHHFVTAAIGEFCGSIADAKIRQQFIDQLCKQFNVMMENVSKEATALAADCIIPTEQQYLVTAIEQDLRMRDKGMAYRKGILLEGHSGIGKSTLFTALLENNGFSQRHLQTNSRYYVISAGEHTPVRSLLFNAFNERSAIVANELNLDPSLEDMLNNILDNDESQRSKTKQSGGLVLGTQNPSASYKGRKAQSRGLRNRMHMLFMDPHSVEALVQIANKAGVDRPHEYVKAYITCSNNHNYLNFRSFFELLTRASQHQPAKK